MSCNLQYSPSLAGVDQPDLEPTEGVKECQNQNYSWYTEFMRQCLPKEELQRLVDETKDGRAFTPNSVFAQIAEQVIGDATCSLQAKEERLVRDQMHKMVSVARKHGGRQVVDCPHNICFDEVFSHFSVIRFQCGHR